VFDPAGFAEKEQSVVRGRRQGEANKLSDCKSGDAACDHGVKTISAKKARLALDASRASELNYLADGTGAGAGAGAVGQHEAARTETAAAMTRNLTVFIFIVWLLFSLHLSEFRPARRQTSGSIS
jgi:hypothetical protein